MPTRQTLEHEQPPLFPPTAVEVVLRAGVVHEGDHLQMQVEVRSATDGTLMALWSLPHSTLSMTHSAMQQAWSEWRDRMLEVTSPFQ